MSLLISSEALRRRRDAARGPLAPLVSSLRADLQRLLDEGFEIPAAKALLSRDGGRCARDATQLEFDPYRPHEHRCPTCGEIYRGERHDRWWVMSYQLWLAERAVHAAALNALAGEEALAELTRRILLGYTDRYLTYPNRDNVLGPTRPFFSTYLESIWLLQLCVALDLLEASGSAGPIGGTLRERVIEPSVQLIASFDEGASNRQVWNNAAMIAAGLTLGRRSVPERAIHGGSGLVAHLTHNLLPDGTWYEGENYHFFAHRGLWYGVTMAERAEFEVPRTLRERFDEAFATPLATALPDFTFPSRRDSQYGISLRQWRFAESCELGLARRDDARLIGALWELYERDLPRRDTGRWRSTAEVERNEPPSSLSRADLSWRSLLLARETLPRLEPMAARSALLEGQGIAVLRRDDGRLYTALDYGHSGGGHGHPDRLNLLLVHGNQRWLDDVGTGSYVDPSLHWYRSTLAHNAPLVNGHSQWRANGVLRAFEERGDVGWVDAEVPLGGLAPGVRVRRSLVVMPGYAVDRVSWESDAEIRLELPLHLAARLVGIGEWRPAPIDGGADLEDGFSFVTDTAAADAPLGSVVKLEPTSVTSGAAWALASGACRWWRATAPGAPGQGAREFLVARLYGSQGSLTTVWSWANAVEHVTAHESALVVLLATGGRHEHAPGTDDWRVEISRGDERSTIQLGGARAVPQIESRLRAVAGLPDEVLVLQPSCDATPWSPVVFTLGKASYRISEETWEEAGQPEATVSVHADPDRLVVDVEVRKTQLVFRSARAPDPQLDNEHPDIHSDGVQLYVLSPEWTRPAAWLAVPEEDSTLVRVRIADGARDDVPLTASWHRTPLGYAMRFSVPLSALGDPTRTPFGIGLIVNDMAPGRVRRSGQLALRGGAGEYVYLRGDRESPANFRYFLVARD